MSIEYLGLNEINGPLVVLEGVQNASFEEIVEIVVDNNEKKLGRIVETFNEALYKAFIGAGIKLPKHKNMIMTLKDADKEEGIEINFAAKIAVADCIITAVL